ncbi:putative ribonuclease H-like domain-containing protein [Tanacetum coccineum]
MEISSSTMVSPLNDHTRQAQVNLAGSPTELKLFVVYICSNAYYARRSLPNSKTRDEAKDAAARYGYLFSQATAEILSQAEAEIRNQGVSADRDPAGIDSADSVSAVSDSAGSNPAGSFQPAASYEPLVRAICLCRTSVSADFIPVPADEAPTRFLLIILGPQAPAEEVNPFLTKSGEHNSSTVTDSCDLSSSGLKWILKNKMDGQRKDLIDVKSAFLYGEIEEEVYVTQPKALKILTSPKQCTRRGTIDKTLFIKKDSRDILLVQVYVDDIIFGSTNKAWCEEFEVLMQGEFEMSAMGEMSFFLGLQVKQLPDGIFISQDKYVKDMLTKFDMESARTATTPYEAAKTKLKDESDPPVNVHLYRSMIGSLMYLTASRPDIMFAVSACSRHQVTPLTSHLNAVKKIFKYLKGQPKLGLWYPKDSLFKLEAYIDSWNMLVAAASFCTTVNLPAVCFVPAGSTMIMLLWSVSACCLHVFLLIGCLLPLAAYIHAAGVVYAAYTSIYAAELFILSAVLSDHNKIAFLGREKGCEDFTDILSYLDHSPLRYALTYAPPVVFDSLVKQFWATAVVPAPNAAGSP